MNKAGVSMAEISFHPVKSSVSACGEPAVSSERCTAGLLMQQRGTHGQPSEDCPDAVDAVIGMLTL
uniref:Uncharacterized protein n=1 Tax=Peronospora matthiolae TaxID=2874970 RepID=A0AAV1U8X8_9STRA